MHGSAETPPRLFRAQKKLGKVRKFLPALKAIVIVLLTKASSELSDKEGEGKEKRQEKEKKKYKDRLVGSCVLNADKCQKSN